MAGKPRIKIDFNKIYTSNTYGNFKIIKDLGCDDKSRRYVRIKFLDTGYENDVRYDIALDGKVKDELYGIDFNKEYESMYYGKFKIIKYNGRNKESKKIVRIKFLNTGYETDTLLKLVNSGKVKDYSVTDRQFISYDSKNYNSFIKDILVNRWRSMMSRCYNTNNSKYNNYGQIGVTVCDYWKSVDNYINSMPSIFNFNKFYLNPEKYQLDKDLLQLNIPKNNRIYSPETCIFISDVDNANLAIKENHNNLYGVRLLKNGNYKVTFSVNGNRYSFGEYSDKFIAMSEYNYYYYKYGEFELVPLINDLAFEIDHDYALKYLVKEGNFCNLIE